jgi:hypothetical protein
MIRSNTFKKLLLLTQEIVTITKETLHTLAGLSSFKPLNLTFAMTC